MELIPILSTIILVATISTFILAIGAYILYKIREAKGQQVSVPVPSTVKAELITPLEVTSPIGFEQPRAVPQPIYIEQPGPIQYQPSVQPVYTQNQQFTPSPRQYYPEPGFSEVRNYQTPVPPPRQKTDTKFMKYTDEGYTPANKDKEEKSNGALRWK